MKEKILNMSYQNLMCFEVKCPYTYDNDMNTMDENYKTLLENFELGKDIDVKVYAKDKENQIMTKIIDDAKLIDITKDKATISIYSKDSEVLNNYKDTYDIILSNMNIESNKGKKIIRIKDLNNQAKLRAAFLKWRFNLIPIDYLDRLKKIRKVCFFFFPCLLFLAFFFTALFFTALLFTVFLLAGFFLLGAFLLTGRSYS